MAKRCQCKLCNNSRNHDDWEWHQQLCLILPRLDEQARRWVAAAEANRLGFGGIRLVSSISGLTEPTIRRGQRELAAKLVGRPVGRIRRRGAGRLSTEKKTLGSKSH